MTMLDAALAYARAGWPVFPCDPRQDPPGTPPPRKRAKRPLVPGADKDAAGKTIPKTGGLWRATTDEAQIRAWWGRMPHALIGVPTGSRIGAFVVDLDPRGESLDAVVKRLFETVGEFHCSVQSLTQSGGNHMWFRLPEGEDLPKNSAGRLKGVDWRGDGGYVIVPPSVMSDGAAYEWLYAPEQFAFEPGLFGPEVDSFEPLEPAPPRLLDLIFKRGEFARDAGAGDAADRGLEPGNLAQVRARLDDPGEKRVRAYAVSALDRAVADVAGAVKGTRGHTLNAAAYGVAPLVGLGHLSEREVFAALRDAADVSGLTAADGREERDAKIRRGLDAGRGNTGPLALKLDEIRRDAADKAARYSSPRAPEPPPYGEPAGGRSAAAGAPADKRRPAAIDAVFDEAARAKAASERERRLGALIACAGLDHSDTDNGRRLIAHFGQDLLVLEAEGARNMDFVTWSGTHWDMRTGMDAAFRLAQQLGELIMAEAKVMELTSFEREPIEEFARAELEDDADAMKAWRKAAIEAAECYEARQISRRKFGVSSKNKSRLEAMLACAAPYLTRPPEAFNANPLRLATRGHTLTFSREPVEGDSSVFSARLDAVQGHERAHLISRALPVDYDPAARCPRWEAFLAEFLPDAEVRRFVQVFSGLGLTGLPIQKLIYHYGKGANGKSVFLEVLCRVLGDLAMTLQSETVTGMAERSAQQASPDLARLYGRWCVRVPELPQDEPIREALVKKLTGGEAIPVRNLFKGQFEFVPVAKAHMSGNGFPRIDGTDNGIWRRMAVVEWPVTLAAERQRNFADVVGEFMEEASGILNWLIEGAVAYLAEGLHEPDAVKAATQDYRDEMDPIGLFVAACVVAAPGGSVTGREMYEAYKAWSEASGLRPRSETIFGKVMKTKLKREDGRVRTYRDVALVDVPERAHGHSPPGDGGAPRSPGDAWPD
ncbi:MAG: hypothetical protein DI565_00600 [Ancylobacter novellus]|uniref:SF3 helicase domain-containing protein n=1 Tax=Ancylobacter novellus TaxID=921 RepID=A0A2W5KU41_ANCNO|nr:MAG: hypothetical protein DI565_00600 [Ancylobacter novellus]